MMPAFTRKRSVSLFCSFVVGIHIVLPADEASEVALLKLFSIAYSYSTSLSFGNGRCTDRLLHRAPYVMRHGISQTRYNHESCTQISKQDLCSYASVACTTNSSRTLHVEMTPWLAISNHVSTIS